MNRDARTRRWLLGFDGGGTKTAAVLADGDGRILARTRTRGCAVDGAPHTGAIAVMRSVARTLVAQAGGTPAAIVQACVGLNGVDFPGEHDVQRAGVAAALELPVARVTLVNDAIPALWGATTAPAAAIIQHGTGFTAAWRHQPGAEHLFDHLGTGRQYDLRDQLLVAVSRMLDGRLPVTPLLAAALAHYGIADRSEFPELLYRGRLRGDRLWSSVPVVCTAWEAGDRVATMLAEAAIADYVQTADALLAKIGDPAATLALGGGVFRAAGARLFTAVAEGITAAHPAVTVVNPPLPPEYGAVLLAAHHRGEQTDRLRAALAGQQAAGTTGATVDLAQVPGA